MRAVITGVAGFVGSSLADALLAQGADVTGIDCFVNYYPKAIKQKNLESALSHSRFNFIEGNLLELPLEKLLEGTDVIFHQAAQAGVRASWGKTFSIYTDNNILATQQLLEATRSETVRKSLKRIVYASSSSVYGTAETLPTTEKILPKPVSPYGVSKLAAEHLMVLYTSEFDVPTISLRYFTVYGPRQRPDMAFNRFIRAALAGEKITVYGDGEQSRDFTFISDIVAANISAAQLSNETAPLVFNLGGGSRVTVNETITMLEEIIGKKIIVDRQSRAYGDARHTGADTTLAKKYLNFEPKVSLRQGLEQETRWMDEALRHGYSVE